ncbi:RNA methyltransferase [Oceanobacillus luteolus]|uniref:TrmH family RNA methyltransferase n=1 Tax=Oceanobacillus luteolus TaxID=1274358 RepID=A0ABW4HRJ3_9BACI
MKTLITSLTNEKVKYWRKLHKKKGRKENKVFLVEGLHLIEEAWNSKQVIIEIIAEETVELPRWSGNIPVERVSKQVFEHISQTMTPQGIAAVVQIQPQREMKGNQFVLLDAIQDPGNLGTIIRTADAAGMDAVILGKGTVDIFNDKVVRATQGSLFHIPIYEADLVHKVDELQKGGFDIWATALEKADYYHEVEVPDKVAIILGNEGAGVHPDLIELADKRIKIPIYGKAESLNVSIAAGILMYHIKQ